VFTNICSLLIEKDGRACRNILIKFQFVFMCLSYCNLFKFSFPLFCVCELTVLVLEYSALYFHMLTRIFCLQLPPWLSFLPEDNFTVEVDVPKDSRATLHVNGYKKTLSSEQSHHLQSMLINTHFPPLLQLATRRGHLGKLS
jgi:hypothetical protein